MPSTDYALAKRMVLRDFRQGELSRDEVCDAHPELLRAARHIGAHTDAVCPVCGGRGLRHVSYVYGDGLKRANGTCISHARELERLGSSVDEFARYVVEVCIDCSWNHLVQRHLMGRRHAG
ncbi:MAG: DUF5318 family protein [Acidimicrobiia bacterium]